MSVFRRELEQRQHRTRDTGRRWLFVSYDQLSAEVGPLANEDPRTLGIVLVANGFVLLSHTDARKGTDASRDSCVTGDPPVAPDTLHRPGTAPWTPRRSSLALLDHV